MGVQGYAGTGKPTMLERFRSLAESAGYRVKGLAPSASATRTPWDGSREHGARPCSATGRDAAQLVTDDPERLADQLQRATGERVAALDAVAP